MTVNSGARTEPSALAGFAPLVEPVADLSAEAAARAQRQLSLPGFGDVAQRRIAGARVLVIGAGGLGCACVPYLAGAGVGRIGIIDDDVIELSNLHRQIVYTVDDVARPKVDALADAVTAQNPEVVVDRVQQRLSAENARELFANYDLVLDGSDNFATRYLANDAAQLTRTPLVWGAILQFSGQVSVAWHEYGPGYRDLFPQPPAPENVMNCAEGGVLPSLCGTIGSLMATEALKLITGVGSPLVGRVLLYEALQARTRELPVNRDPRAAPVTRLIDYDLFCGTRGAASVASRAAGVSAQEFAAAETPETRSDAGAPHVIDVRTAAEFFARHVRGAVRVDVDRIAAGDLGPLTGREHDPVLVYCERDPRSIRAAESLIDHGFSDVSYLVGGIDAFARLAPDRVERSTHAPVEGNRS